MAKKLRVIHRNRIFSECLSELLSEKYTLSDTPDVLIIDLGISNALELVRNTRSIVLVESINTDVAAAFESGAQGCITEDSSLDELCAAIEAVFIGRVYCPPDMIQIVVKRLSSSSLPQRAGGLTGRELEVLRLVSEHFGNKQIASRLGVSIYTIKNHMHNIVEKLNVGTRYEAVDYAVRNNWITRGTKHGATV